MHRVGQLNVIYRFFTRQPTFSVAQPNAAMLMFSFLFGGKESLLLGMKMFFILQKSHAVNSNKQSDQFLIVCQFLAGKNKF